VPAAHRSAAAAQAAKVKAWIFDVVIWVSEKFV
jgi:hypothetical protein